MGADDEPVPISRALRLMYFIVDCVDKPVVWFKENIVKPNQQKTYWYHEKIRRIPSVDQCYEDDVVCIYEANEQYLRDRAVEKTIVQILKKRADNCYNEHINEKDVCEPLREYYENALNNYFIKYGDLGLLQSAVACLMKQKHRMAWERRHGPVGTGKKQDRKGVEEEE